MAEKLHNYASGDGALHFAWQVDGICTGRRVLMWQARRCLRLKAQRHLVGWRVVELNGEPVAVAPVKRVDADHVELECVYRYTVDESLRFKDRKLLSPSVRLYWVDGDIERECINWSIRSQVIHFLNHEKELTEQAGGVMEQYIVRADGYQKIVTERRMAVVCDGMEVLVVNALSEEQARLWLSEVSVQPLPAKANPWRRPVWRVVWPGGAAVVKSPSDCVVIDQETPLLPVVAAATVDVVCENGRTVIEFGTDGSPVRIGLTDEQADRLRLRLGRDET